MRASAAAAAAATATKNLQNARTQPNK